MLQDVVYVMCIAIAIAAAAAAVVICMQSECCVVQRSVSLLTFLRIVPRSVA
jgi:hypothetical protein